MKTLADIIIHLRDKVAPLVTGETRELVNDAIYAIKAISTKQHLDQRLARLQTPRPTEGMTPIEFDQFITDFFTKGYADADTLRRFVAEAARLRAEVDRLRLENEQLKFIYLEDAKSIGALVGENERLRAELAERERQIEALGRLDGQ